MLNFIRKLLGYEEMVVVKKTLDVKKTYVKKFWIDWKVVGRNVITLFKHWPRRGKYQKFYHEKVVVPEKVLGYIPPNLIKAAIEENNKAFYLHGHLMKDTIKFSTNDKKET